MMVQVSGSPSGSVAESVTLTGVSSCVDSLTACATGARLGIS